MLALIDRNFQGFGKEIFTDAGKYVIHFGQQPDEAAQNVANTIQAAHPDKPKPPVTAIAKLRTGVSVIPTQAGNQLVSPAAALSFLICTSASCIGHRHQSAASDRLPYAAAHVAFPARRLPLSIGLQMMSYLRILLHDST